MGRPVSRRCHGRAATHAAALLVAMAAMANGARPAAPSAAARRLIALMEDEELEEQRRLAAEQRAAREKAAAAERAAVQKGVDPKTDEINRYIASKFAAWLEVHGEAYGYDAAAGPTVALAVNVARLDAVSQLTEYFEALKNDMKKDGFMTVEADRCAAREFEA